MSGVGPVGTDVLRLAAVLIVALALVSMVGLWRVISRDAQERGISEGTATVWAFGAISLFPLVAPLYLLFVVRPRTRETALQTRERWLLWLSGSLAVSFVVSATVTPPDPFTQVAAVLAVFPLAAAGTYLVVFERRRLFSSDPT